jgi:hypothetical protein
VLLNAVREIVNVKGKVDPMLNYAPHYEDVWGSGGIALPFLISTLGGNEWSTSSPNRFTPGEKGPRFPLDRRLDGP